MANIIFADLVMIFILYFLLKYKIRDHIALLEINNNNIHDFKSVLLFIKSSKLLFNYVLLIHILLPIYLGEKKTSYLERKLVSKIKWKSFFFIFLFNIGIIFNYIIFHQSLGCAECRL